MHISMEDRILAALRSVVDPESGVNIVDLGLVYAVGVLPGGDVYVQMTLTKPASPVNAGLADEAEDAVRRAFAGARSVYVQLVWDPPWHPSMMSRSARLELSRKNSADPSGAAGVVQPPAADDSPTTPTPR